MQIPRLIWLLSVVFAGACRSSSSIKEYVVGDPAPVATSVVHSGPLPVDLRQLSLRPFLNREGIAYRQGPVRGGSYVFHRWAEPVAAMVQRALEVRLSSDERLANLTSAPPLNLRGDILGFHEVTETDGSQVRAVVELRFELEIEDRVEVFFRTEVEPVGGESIDALVESLDRALDRQLDSAADWLAGFLGNTAAFSGKPEGSS